MVWYWNVGDEFERISLQEKLDDEGEREILPYIYCVNDRVNSKNSREFDNIEKATDYAIKLVKKLEE